VEQLREHKGRAKMINEIIDDNPEIKTYLTKDNALIIEKTHNKPQVKSESYNIAELREKIVKIDNVISIWEGKKKPYQDLINLYNIHKPSEIEGK
jgi:hypothetical protein